MSIKHLCAYAILFACVAISCKNKSNEKPIVSVSILPQKYFIEQIAGDLLEINVMIPPGMSPANCDLSMAKLQKLNDSDICFSMGHLPFETTHLYPVLKNKKDIQLIYHSDNIELIGGSCCAAHAEEGEGIDPHIWMSITNANSIANDIYNTLAKRYPKQESKMKINYEVLKAQIDSMAMNTEQLFKDNKHNAFLIYHPALSYFASDYGLEQIAIEDDGKEPNPMHLKEVIDIARQKGIELIFIQKQFDLTNAQSIANEIGGKVISIDPLEENWMEGMKKLIDIFKMTQTTIQN